MKNAGTPIQFHYIENARELGGIMNRHGQRIRQSCLIRSGMLCLADAYDIEQLQKLNVKKIIDFRSGQERSEKPDVSVSGAENIHIPIVDQAKMGITREANNIGPDYFINSVLEDPEAGKKFMKNSYRDFVTNDFAVHQYAKFINEVVDTKDGAVLWHCAGGKDRTGFAAVLMLELLEVDRDFIIADYLCTNAFNHKDIENMMRNAEAAVLPEHVDRESFKSSLRDFCLASEDYIGEAYQAAEEAYGSMQNYLRDALGVTEDIKRQLQQRYLNRKSAD